MAGECLGVVVEKEEARVAEAMEGATEGVAMAAAVSGVAMAAAPLVAVGMVAVK
jgi:hypothetical protein